MSKQTLNKNSKYYAIPKLAKRRITLLHEQIVMKLIYTNENRYLVHNIQNLIENADIEIMLKNEFLAGAAGDLVPHETWLELWVVNDSDYDKAMQTIESSFSSNDDSEWVCKNCNEKNDASFEFCWNCQYSAPPPS